MYLTKLLAYSTVASLTTGGLELLLLTEPLLHGAAAAAGAGGLGLLPGKVPTTDVVVEDTLPTTVVRS